MLDATGKHKEAIETYDKALKIKPDFDAVWFNKACAHALLSSRDDAMSSLKKAIELNPRYKSIAKNTPDFSELKGSADFEKIIGE